MFDVCSLSKQSQTIKDLTLPFPVGRSFRWLPLVASFGVAPPGAPVSFAPGTRNTRWIQNVGLRQKELYHGEAVATAKKTRLDMIGCAWRYIFRHIFSVFQGVTPTACTRNLLADKLLNEADAFIKVQVLGLRSDKHPTSNYGKNQDTLPNLYMSDCIS